MLNSINEAFGLHKVDLRTYSPLALAFIGDSVFATVVKTVIIERGNCQGAKLHSYSAHLVRAESQAKMFDLWKEIITEEEGDILKRGRNAKSVNGTKYASEEDYRKATAVEALTGYLFLAGCEERLCELIRLGIDAVLDADNGKDA
ncbi:MAG: ribonuclease III [Lachnospiraceae bacterium]|nr:ribonuclease III [Lachnospiraceae bacterium]